MNDATLTTILTSRGYQRVASPDRTWRNWLWVAPLREGAMPTKLCSGWIGNLSEEGLHFLLDHYVEMKPECSYYTDEDRARNATRMSLKGTEQ